MASIRQKDGKWQARVRRRGFADEAKDLQHPRRCGTMGATCLAHDGLGRTHITGRASHHSPRRGSNTNGCISKKEFAVAPVCVHVACVIASTAARSAAALRLLVVTATFCASPEVVVSARTSRAWRRFDNG